MKYSSHASIKTNLLYRSQRNQSIIDDCDQCSPLIKQYRSVAIYSVVEHCTAILRGLPFLYQ